MSSAVESIPFAAARRLFMQGQRLLVDPALPASPDLVQAEIEALGFVQLDSINVVERAHHHILWTRLHDYRPHQLDTLQRAGRVFEGWTHDASIIPSQLFPHWRHRFERPGWGPWLRRRIGRNYRKIIAQVLERVRREGPLRARDFEHRGRRGGGSGPWWDWKPAKAALEYLWHSGELAIPRRKSFQKVYDLTERVLPHVVGLPAPPLEEHVEWACRSALGRLGVATAREVAAFWNAVTPAQAARWCAERARTGEVVPAALNGEDERAARLSYAWADWRNWAAAVPPAGAGMRVLSPFDPLIRDRARCLRLFGFDYRLEVFVPEAKRKFGYYVLPVLEGERLVARLDPRLDREAGVLHVRRVWWEPGVRVTRARRDGLGAALERYGAFTGSASIELTA